MITSKLRRIEPNMFICTFLSISIRPSWLWITTCFNSLTRQWLRGKMYPALLPSNVLWQQQKHLILSLDVGGREWGWAGAFSIEKWEKYTPDIAFHRGPVLGQFLRPLWTTCQRKLHKITGNSITPCVSLSFFLVSLQRTTHLYS